MRLRPRPRSSCRASSTAQVLLCLIGREGYPGSAQEAQRIRLVVPQPQREVVPLLARPQQSRPLVALRHRPTQWSYHCSDRCRSETG